MTQLSHDQIAQRSFMIWEQEGRPDGQALDHWLQAERELSELFTPRKKLAAPAKRAKAAGGEKLKKAGKVAKAPALKAKKSKA